MAGIPDKRKNTVIEWMKTRYRQRGSVYLDESQRHIEALGFSRSKKTIYRWIKEAVDEVNSVKGEQGFDIDSALDFSDTETMSDYRLNISNVPLLRQAFGYFNYNNAEWSIDEVPTYRWAKWSTYFLDALPTDFIKNKITDHDVWTVGQYLASRDLDRERTHSQLNTETATFKDVEDWLNYQPFVDEDRNRMYQQSIKNESATALVPLIDKSNYGTDVQATPDLLSNLFIHLCQFTGISGTGLLPQDQLLKVQKYTQEKQPEKTYLKTRIFTSEPFGMSPVIYRDDRYIE